MSLHKSFKTKVKNECRLKINNGNKRVYIKIPSIVIPLALKWHSDQIPSTEMTGCSLFWPPHHFCQGHYDYPIIFVEWNFDHYVILELRGLRSRGFWASWGNQIIMNKVLTLECLYLTVVSNYCFGDYSKWWGIYQQTVYKHYYYKHA